MDILYSTGKLEKEFNSHALLIRRRGPRQGELIEKRLTQIRAANTLEDLRTLPQLRCHELTGNLQGQISLDLDHPYRLIVSPGNDPIPRKPDGGLDWGQVTAIIILEVSDTHG